MGIYDREYYRRSDRGFLSSGGPGTILWPILWINVGIYVLQILSLRNGGVTAWLGLSPVHVIEGFQVWRLLTYGFCHDPSNIWHIVFNMLFLYWFAGQLEAIYGSAEFLRFYLAAIILSGIAYLLFAVAIGSAAYSIGASGGVMAVTMLYAMYYPRQKLLLFFIIPVEVRWIVLFYLIVDLHPVLLALSGSMPTSNVAHAAHLGGLLYGYLYYKFDLRFTNFTGRFRVSWPQRKPKNRANLKVYREPTPSDPPEPNNIDERVDEILSKISEQGQDSLSDEERTILREASKRLRDRRSP